MMNRMQALRSILQLIAVCGLLLQGSFALAEKKPPATALDEVHQKLESLKKELSSSTEAHKDAADALKESEKAISAANRKLYEINKQQQQNKHTLAKLQAESAQTSQLLAEQQKLLSSQLYQQYLHGEQSYVQMMLQSDKPSQIARDMHYFSYIAKARGETIRQMRKNLATIEKLNVQTEATLEKVAELKQKQIEEKHNLEQQKATKSKVVKSLSKQIAAQRNEIQKLKRDEKRLSQLIEKLAKAATSRPKPSKKTEPYSSESESNTAKNRTVIASNDKLPDDGVSGIHFAALKGKLRLPVRGDVTNKFGSSRQDSGISWKGLFIRANEGAEVKAIAGGRIVFADWLRGFGNLIIVDHGDGYMSLYGNNQTILKQAGESVRGGESIAYVGNSGGNETHGLYYELRRQSRPFDPLSWSDLN